METEDLENDCNVILHTNWRIKRFADDIRSKI